MDHASHLRIVITEHGVFHGEPNMTLVIQNLSHERNNQLLFSEIKFTLAAGELLQVRGTNGSGKSTLLRILAGYIEPLAGKILWNETSIFDYTEFYQEHINYIGHHNGIKPLLTVYENLKLCAALANESESTEIKKIIETIGLSQLTNTPALQLSAGQQRRLALGRLLLYPTSLWILDEPTTSLDAQGQDLLTELLKQHLKNGGMSIVATHHDLPLTTRLIELGEKNA